MKVAICISGQLRNLTKNNPVIALIERTRADVFISTWGDVGATSAHDRFFPNVSIAELIIGLDAQQRFKYDINDFKARYPALYQLFYSSSTLDETAVRAIIPNVRAVNVESLPAEFESKRTLKGIVYPEGLLDVMPSRYMFSLPMFYKIHDANRLKREFESLNGFKYDTVIRVRTDLEYKDLNEIVEISEGYHADDEISTTTNDSGREDDLFLNDTFAIGSSASMDVYANVFEGLKAYWDFGEYPDFPLDKRAAECLLGYHVKKKSKLKCRGIKSRVQVTTAIARKGALEVFPAFLKDLSCRVEPSQAELKAYALLLNSYHRENKTTVCAPAPEVIKYIAIEKSWLFGNAALRENDITSALYLLERSHHYLKEHDPRPTIDYAGLLMKQGETVKALDALLSAALRNEKNHILLRNIGIAYFELYKESTNLQKSFNLQLAWSYLQQACKLGGYKNVPALKAGIEACRARQDEHSVMILSDHLSAIENKGVNL